MTTGTWPLIGWGLGIRSALSIPGAATAALDFPTSIIVEFGRPDRWAAREEWGPYRVRDADLFDFTMDGVATFTCRDRNRVSIAPANGAREPDMAAMLVATALPALLWARGEILIHAAAASRAGRRGMMFAGASGSGKSSLLGRAIGRGLGAIGDDSIRLRIDLGRLLASGLPAGRWMRPAEAGSDRIFAPVPAAQQVIESEVNRLVLLDAHGTRPRPLCGHDAFVALWSLRHRPRITRLLRTDRSFVLPMSKFAAMLHAHAVPGYDPIDSRSGNRLTRRAEGNDDVDVETAG